MTDLPEGSTARPLLIVDDDATFGRVLARALCSRGFEVHHRQQLRRGPRAHAAGTSRATACSTSNWARRTACA